MTENIDTNSTFLIDLNTTEEGSTGVQVHYVLSNTETEGNLFTSAKFLLIQSSYGSVNKIFVLITVAPKPPFNVYSDISSKSICVHSGLSLHLYPLFRYARSEG